MRLSCVLRTIREGKVARVLKLNTADAKVAEIFAAAQPDRAIGCAWSNTPRRVGRSKTRSAAKLYDVDTLLRVSRGSYSDYIRGYEMDPPG
jgi:4-hydroxy-2-oxoheptanedioate aldolase